MGTGYVGIGGLGGYLADKWEVVGIGDMKFHIRKGVHWALNPNSEASRLVNGRLFTVDDAVYNLNRYFTDPRSNTNLTEPALAKAASVTKLDSENMEIKTPVNPWTGFLLFDYGITLFTFRLRLSRSTATCWTGATRWAPGPSCLPIMSTAPRQP